MQRHVHTKMQDVMKKIQKLIGIDMLCFAIQNSTMHSSPVNQQQNHWSLQTFRYTQTFHISIEFPLLHIDEYMEWMHSKHCELVDQAGCHIFKHTSMLTWIDCGVIWSQLIDTHQCLVFIELSCLVPDTCHHVRNRHLLDQGQLFLPVCF